MLSCKPHTIVAQISLISKSHNVVLLAVCNARYEFIMVDIGDSGRQSDGSVYHSSHLGCAIENNALSIPNHAVVVRDPRSILTYVFVADDVFGLKTYLMKPCPNNKIQLGQQIFSHRLSQARRTIENTFGIANTFSNTSKAHYCKTGKNYSIYTSCTGFTQLSKEKMHKCR